MGLHAHTVQTYSKHMFAPRLVSVFIAALIRAVFPIPIPPEIAARLDAPFRTHSNLPLNNAQFNRPANHCILKLDFQSVFPIHLSSFFLPFISKTYTFFSTCKTILNRFIQTLFHYTVLAGNCPCVSKSKHNKDANFT